jgi:hypothetical protein
MGWSGFMARPEIMHSGQAREAIPARFTDGGWPDQRGEGLLLAKMLTEEASVPGRRHGPGDHARRSAQQQGAAVGHSKETGHLRETAEACGPHHDFAVEDARRRDNEAKSQDGLTRCLPAQE